MNSIATIWAALPTGLLANPPTPTVTPQNLVTELRNWIAPIVFLVLAGIALSFLVRRQVSQFIQFIAIAVGVMVLFYSPEIIGSIARLVSGWAGAPVP